MHKVALKQHFSKPRNLEYIIHSLIKLGTEKVSSLQYYILYIFTFLYPDSPPASADPPPSPHSHSSSTSDVDRNGTTGLKPTAGNAPDCVCVCVDMVCIISFSHH